MAEKYVAYYRVSTAKQGRSGLGLEAQKAAVAGYLSGGAVLAAEVVEVESGKRADRPELARALRLCRLHGAVLIVAKLDRLARNVYFISALMEAGVKFVAVDLPTCNEMTVHILAAVAQGEAKAISDRTKAALQAARARGVVLGGDCGERMKIKTQASKGAAASVAVRQENASKRAADVLEVIADIKAATESIALSLRQLAAALNERGILTARGGEWSAVQVQRVLAKASA